MQPHIYEKPASIIPVNDTERLKALYRYEILDTPPEAFFDKITHFASKFLKVPSAFVSLVDKDRVWYKSNLSSLNVVCVDREDSLCSLTIINNTDVTVFNDTHLVSGLMDSPYVSAEGGIRFYAGAPLISPDGYYLGTICVVDSKPREITDDEKETLKELATLVIAQMELRAMARRAVRKHDELYTTVTLNVSEPVAQQLVLLNELQGSPSQAHVIRKINTVANSIYTNVQAILTDSAQEEEVIMPALSTTAMADIATEVIQQCTAEADAKNQELFFTVASRRELMIDPELMQEALSSLLSFNIKFSPPGSPIALDIYEADGSFIVEVSAEDSVLTDKDNTKVFSKYAILSSRPTAGENMTGLELARIKSIINKHKGIITLETFPRGNGSKFVINFPIE